MTLLEGTWVNDRRGDGRAVKVSAHAEAGFLVVSTWKAGTCVGTVRLLPAEAAELIAGLSESLARLASAAHAGDDLDR
jgi:predicted benzoate:H+ symporter BenE